jgi:hypothetical protein
MMLRDALKGPTGGYDTARILFALGGLNSVVAPLVFQSWAMWRGQAWDPAAFCIAYGGLLSSIILGGGFGIAAKDKGVASAINTTTPQPVGGQP